MSLDERHVIELVVFLKEVVSFDSVNKMAMHNIATVFGPNLLKKQDESIMDKVQDIPYVNEVVNTLLKDYDYIFDKKPIPVVLPPYTKPVNATKLVRALFDYHAAEDNEISFHVHDRFYVTLLGQDDWWTGVLADGSTGLFPFNYVETLVDYRIIDKPAEPQPSVDEADDSGDENAGEMPSPPSEAPPVDDVPAPVEAVKPVEPAKSRGMSMTQPKPVEPAKPRGQTMTQPKPVEQPEPVKKEESNVAPVVVATAAVATAAAVVVVATSDNKPTPAPVAEPQPSPQIPVIVVKEEPVTKDAVAPPAASVAPARSHKHAEEENRPDSPPNASDEAKAMRKKKLKDEMAHLRSRLSEETTARLEAEAERDDYVKQLTLEKARTTELRVCNCVVILMSPLETTSGE